MRSSVIISHMPSKPGHYEITVIRADGRKISSLAGGSELGEVAGRAAMYAAEHCLPNVLGGDVVGPTKIIDLIPPHLRSIPKMSEREI